MATCAVCRRDFPRQDLAAQLVVRYFNSPQWAEVDIFWDACADCADDDDARCSPLAAAFHRYVNHLATLHRLPRSQVPDVQLRLSSSSLAGVC